MAQSGSTPETAPRNLFVLRGGTGDAMPALEPATEPPLPVPAAVPMTVPERARLGTARWAGTAVNAAGQLWLHRGRVLHALWHGTPETMAEHRAYVQSRAWVPRELTGKPATAITVAGIIYHLLIARPVKAAAKAVDAAAERPLRFLMLTAFVIVLAVILLNL